jgi:hypothetical protein
MSESGSFRTEEHAELAVGRPPESSFRLGPDQADQLKLFMFRMLQASFTFMKGSKRARISAGSSYKASHPAECVFKKRRQAS